MAIGGLDCREFFLAFVRVAVSWDTLFVLWGPSVPRKCGLMGLATLVVMHIGFSSMALRATASFQCMLNSCKGELDWLCIWSTELMHSSFFYA